MKNRKRRKPDKNNVRYKEKSKEKQKGKQEKNRKGEKTE